MVNSRRKGIGGELEACKLFRPYFPDVRRSFGQARMGFEQPDLIGGIEKHFFVEVKRCKKEPTKGVIEKWLAKLKSDYVKYRSKGGDPAPYLLLMWRPDGQGWWVKWHRLSSGCSYFKTSDWRGFVSQTIICFYSPTVLSPTKNMEVRDE